MTDHANELRRHARKIPHPQGETPGVLLRAADEIECLRTKIAEMEKQEPVATVIKEGDSRYWMSERLWTFPNGKYPLYALPGAQGEEEE